MRTFEMIRRNDESGVSGTGKVLEGVVLPSGLTIVEWCSAIHITSWGMYKSFEEFEKVHITSHPTNKTEIIWHEAS